MDIEHQYDCAHVCAYAYAYMQDQVFNKKIMASWNLTDFVPTALTPPIL